MDKEEVYYIRLDIRLAILYVYRKPGFPAMYMLSTGIHHLRTILWDYELKHNVDLEDKWFLLSSELIDDFDYRLTKMPKGHRESEYYSSIINQYCYYGFDSSNIMLCEKYLKLLFWRIPQDLYLKQIN